MIPAADRDRITGLVLAGGQGSRMGSVDKGWQIYRDRPLIRHVLRRFEPQVGPLLISVHGNRDAYRCLGHGLVDDAATARQGPLAGIAAGLAACTTALLATAPCDTPFLPLDLVARLAAALDDPDVDASVARSGTQVHPVLCVMRVAVGPSLERHLALGRRSVLGWLESLALATVDFADPAGFRNFNTLDALRDPEAHA